jgi:hypothetical protein
LDAQTLSALNLGSKSPNTLEAAPPQPQAQPQPTEPPNGVVQSDHDFLKQEPAATPEPAPVDEGAVPPAAQPVEPQEPQQPQEPPQQAYEGQSLPADYARFFRKTPYETAPPVVQRSTVQRAQTRLGREGFYRGIADGELGDTFKRALVAYQRDAELAPSGRLDLDTLAAMDLLPRRQVVIRPPLPPVPFFYGGPVYRGVWVH